MGRDCENFFRDARVGKCVLYADSQYQRQVSNCTDRAM